MTTIQIVFSSLGAIAVGLVLWVSGRLFLAEGKMLKATILKNVYSPNELTVLINKFGLDDDESGTYYPIIQFVTDKNESITKQLSIGFNPPMSVGKKLYIIYNPNNPGSIVIYPRVLYEVVPALLVLVGIITIILVMLPL